MEEVQLLRDKEIKNAEIWSKVVKGMDLERVAMHQVSLWNVQNLMTPSPQPVMPLILYQETSSRGKLQKGVRYSKVNIHHCDN